MDENVDVEDNPETSVGITLQPYPERPGEPDCAFFVRTGHCSFGHKCRFHHPPDRLIPAHLRDQYPERLGQPQCKFYVKTGKCKFGSTCKYHHPLHVEHPQKNSKKKQQQQLLHSYEKPTVSTTVNDSSSNTATSDAAAAAAVTTDDLHDQLPQHQPNFSSIITTTVPPPRPEEEEEAEKKECAFYKRTGRCKFGAACKFNHNSPSSSYNLQGVITTAAAAGGQEGVLAAGHSPPPAALFSDYYYSFYNNYYYNQQATGPAVYTSQQQQQLAYVLNLTMQQQQQQERMPSRRSNWAPSQYWPYCSLWWPYAVSSTAEPSGQQYSHMHLHNSTTTASLLMDIDHPPASSSSRQAAMATIRNVHACYIDDEYPQRPGVAEDCRYYMRTGECSFGRSCKFHHPPHRHIHVVRGLPSYPGAPPCAFYAKHGYCKYGQVCKFDHPLPINTSLVDQTREINVISVTSSGHGTATSTSPEPIDQSLNEMKRI